MVTYEETVCKSRLYSSRVAVSSTCSTSEKKGMHEKRIKKEEPQSAVAGAIRERRSRKYVNNACALGTQKTSLNVINLV